MKILAIIPARAGSKGIANKNIVDFCGQPLIALSISIANQLKDLGYIAEAVVSTDSPRIAEIARKYGIFVPFLRPEELSGDKSKAVEYVLHALGFFKNCGKQFDAVLILQATSPLRELDDVIRAIDSFRKKGGISLISCYKEEYINQSVIYSLGPGGDLSPVDKAHSLGGMRQDHQSIYIRNGAIYISRVDLINQTHRIISDYPMMHLMPKNRSLNIDTPEDLHMAKAMFAYAKAVD